MNEKTTPAVRDLVQEAKAALERLRGYAVGHSAEVTGAIDRIGDFIDKQTGGRFASKVERAQDFARRRLDDFAAPAAPAAPPADPFGVDDDVPPSPGATAWKQPPGQAGQAGQAASASARKAKAELQSAMARLRDFAADNKDNISGLVDKVGDFVDAQTGGRYAQRIDTLQASAKEQLDKRLGRPDSASG